MSTSEGIECGSGATTDGPVAGVSRNMAGVELVIEPCQCDVEMVDDDDDDYDTLDGGAQVTHKFVSSKPPQNHQQPTEYRPRSAPSAQLHHSTAKWRNDSRGKRERAVCARHFRPLHSASRCQLKMDGFGETLAAMHVPLMMGWVQADNRLLQGRDAGCSEVHLVDPTVSTSGQNVKYKFGMKLKTIKDGPYYRHFATDICPGGIADTTFRIRDGDELLLLQSMPLLNMTHCDVLQLFEELLHNLQPAPNTPTITTFTFLLVCRRYEADSGGHIYIKRPGSVQIRHGTSDFIRKGQPYYKDNERSEPPEPPESQPCIIACEAINGYYWHAENNNLSVTDGLTATPEFHWEIVRDYQQPHLCIIRHWAYGEYVFVSCGPNIPPNLQSLETSAYGLPSVIPEHIKFEMEPSRMGPVVTAFRPVSLGGEFLTATRGGNLVTATPSASVPLEESQDFFFKLLDPSDHRW